MDEETHWVSFRTLQGLHDDLRAMVERDPDQEATGIALSALDAVVDEGKALVDDRVVQQIVGVISPETLAAGDPIRAADALIVVGTLKERIGHPPTQVRNAGPRTPYPGT